MRTVVPRRDVLSNVCIASVMFFWWVAPASAAVAFASVFKDGATLQQGKPVNIWGSGNPGEQVTVTYQSPSLVRTASTTTEADGRWMLSLAALPTTAESATLTATGTNSVSIGNVLVGEVWVASGQSNMQMSFFWTARGQLEAAGIRNPLVRYMSIRTSYSGTPLKEFSRNGWLFATGSSTLNMSEVAYHFASELNRTLKVPVAFIQSAYTGTAINSWISREALAGDPAGQAVQSRWDGTISAQAPSAVYNSMINPIFPYSIRGVIWYQGENDVTRPDEYRTLFPSLIKSWRASFGQGDIPFYYVQLAGYNTSKGDWAALREAQTEALSEPNTGMAITIDIGNPTEIHPGDKNEVGRRLAILALARTYGYKNIVDSGPFFDHAVFSSNGAVRVHFSDVAQRLTGASPAGFQLAGADGVFYPAKAEIDGTNTVTVSSGIVLAPAYVRYAWSNPVWEHSVANSAGLPAAPFRASSMSQQGGLTEAESIAQSTASDDVVMLHDSLASAGAGEFLAANGVNDYIAYTLPALQAGTYSVKVGLKKFSSRGQFQLAVDGIKQGSVQDQYAAIASWVELDLGDTTFETSGDKEFKFTVAGKNPKSPAYSLTFDYIKLTPITRSLFEAEELAQATASNSTTVFNDSFASAGAAEFLAASNVNDYIAYTVPGVQAGRYSIKVRFKRYWSRGQFQLAIDGVNQGAVQDQYQSAPSWIEADLGERTFGTAGSKEFKFTVAGKNAKSPAYSLTFDSIKLIPVATSPARSAIASNTGESAKISDD
ncbi:MAG TPA: sialate O-acetylesterase [Terrimicrobiaceae bacterium]